MSRKRLTSSIKKNLKALFMRMINFVNRNPGLRGVVLTIFRKSGLYLILRPFYRSFVKSYLKQKKIETVDDLSPKARQVYFDLKNAIRKKKRGNV